MSTSRILIVCCLMIIAALLVVGAVSHGILRHIVQTAPLWIAIALGARGSQAAKWAALPCFAFWLFLMSLIWLFLLGWAHIVSGTFSTIEIAMTTVVGLASLLGIAKAVRSKSATGWPAATAIALAVLALQIGALRLSLIPQIAHR